jgi:hypothetical protein
MRWVDEDFIRRVEDRAAALGKTLPQVTAEAGVAKEYFRKPPQHGRNIAGILKIAELLKIDPVELMGLHPPLPDDEEMAVAVSLAVSVYCTLKSRRLDDIPDAVALVIRAVRQQFANLPPAEAAPSE